MKRRPPMSRDAAMAARPERADAVHAEERPNGGLLVTVRLPKRRFFRWMSTDGTFERSFGLDPLGREVYEACDGRTSVRSLVRQFAAEHSVTKPEAEVAVTTFLKTLVSRGLVNIAVDKAKVSNR